MPGRGRRGGVPEEGHTQDPTGRMSRLMWRGAVREAAMARAKAEEAEERTRTDPLEHLVRTYPALRPCSHLIIPRIPQQRRGRCPSS